MKRPKSAIWLRDLRERSGLTQAEVAERLNVDQSAVSHWEQGDFRPSKKYHKQLAAMYNIEPQNLIQTEQEG